MVLLKESIFTDRIRLLLNINMMSLIIFVAKVQAALKLSIHMILEKELQESKKQENFCVNTPMKKEKQNRKIIMVL